MVSSGPHIPQTHRGTHDSREPYAEECMALLGDIRPFVGPDGAQDVQRLIDHGEAAEGLNMLA